MSGHHFLLLGGSGFIGSRIHSILLEKFSIRQVQNFVRKDLDLTKEQSVSFLKNIYTPETSLIICAGIKSQRAGDLNAFEHNIQIATRVGQALVEQPVKRIVFLSTLSVYGETRHLTGADEMTPTLPESFYGISKQVSEMILSKISADKKIPLTIVRPPLVFGPSDPIHPYGPSLFIQKLRQRKPIELWGDGSELREFVFVDDLARAMVSLAQSDHQGILNFVTGASLTFRNLIDLLQDIHGVKLQIVERSRTREKVDQSFSAENLRKTLPSLQLTPIYEALLRTYESDFLSFESHS